MRPKVKTNSKPTVPDRTTETEDFVFHKGGRLEKKNINDSDFNAMWCDKYLVDLDTGEIIDERNTE